jgi:ribulose 1,5-bisphosphate synthetase/thiazole synthase
MFCSILVLVKETYLDQTIIIIGAGAAGLMAGREL